MKSDPPLLQLVNVTRVYHSDAGPVPALGPLSLDLHPGEFVAIMGPSGSGKSTLLALAGALDQPTAGQVILAGQNLAGATPTALAELRRRVIGYIFQDLNLLPGLTAAENVALPLELDETPAASARQAATQALTEVGLAHLAQRFPDDLSGGEQQRVAIARAFVGHRRLLLADEPTGALDSVTGENVMRLLHSQTRAGRTALLVTHNAAHAAWADRVIYLRDGLVADEVVAPQPPATTP